jgi:hypothetical protein
VVVFHLIATPGGGPLVKFLLQLLIGLGSERVNSGVHIFYATFETLICSS